MAEQDDYKSLENKWRQDIHKVGSPSLDALIRLVRLAGISRQELAMADGSYFTSSFARDDIPVTNPDTYIVVDTGSKYVILEDIDSIVDYSGVGNGSSMTKTLFYASDSNRNSFTVTGGNPTPLGVPLNLDYVNNVSEALFIFDADVSVTGTEDFLVYNSEYYKDTSGNRESITGLQASFFEAGRKLIMSPNKTYVFRTVRSGTSLGTTSSLTQFSFVETDSEEGE